MRQVRRLTRTTSSTTVDDTRKLCNDAGVALALVKPLPRTRVSGAAWWLSARRPVIALSARHRTDDHLWFSLFHEAAHVLLHGKRDLFVDGMNDDGTTGVETEANDWASNFLVPRAAWRRFVDGGAYRAAEVRRFADEQGIAPGIVVGRLQHAGLVPWNSLLNRLKARLAWDE